MIWKVKETACYPNSWKVYPTHIYQEQNDIGNYFKTREEAQQEANRRNKEYRP